MIILIGKISDLKLFGINIKGKTAKILKKFWPGPVSIILPCRNQKFQYLHRGTESLAFRLPKKADLLKLLQKTGPLVAPSANIEGEKPAQNLDEAQKYFGTYIDFYVDGGELEGKPSELIKISNNKVEILRKSN
jgi:L-threonylcarbamoyladenylate synthase